MVKFRYNLFFCTPATLLTSPQTPQTLWAFSARAKASAARNVLKTCRHASCALKPKQETVAKITEKVQTKKLSTHSDIFPSVKPWRIWKTDDVRWLHNIRSFTEATEAYQNGHKTTLPASAELLAPWNRSSEVNGNICTALWNWRGNKTLLFHLMFHFFTCSMHFGHQWRLEAGTNMVRIDCPLNEWIIHWCLLHSLLCKKKTIRFDVWYFC